MKTSTIHAQFVADAKTKTETRRFRNILANSGRVMESGEIRDIANLYVMGYDGELYRIADLNTNPDEQTEKYSVKAQADHGAVIDGEIVPTIEKQFGSCRVWLEEDGLHARMYFANGDALADHAWAISEDASYSIGMEWYPEGYYGTGKEITEAIGILREISMVLTGNDPRATTIDQKPNEAQGQGAAESGAGNNLNEETIVEPTTDTLTAEEAVELKTALVETVSEAVDQVTEEAQAETETDSLESEPETAEGSEAKEIGTAEESANNKEEITVDNTETTQDTLQSPVTIIKDRAVAQESAPAVKYDWLHSEAGHKAFADTLKQAGRFGATFDSLWRAEASKHMSLDGIVGLPNPAPVEQYFADALEKADGIIDYFQFVPAKSFRVHGLTSESRAQGHKKGDTKVNQEVTDLVRDALVKMVYKRLDLDATELYENPWLIDFRSRELVNAIIAEIERAAIIGDGRTAGEGADYRLFDGTRGFYSVLADANATSGIGQVFASKYTAEAGENLYDAVVSAKGLIKTEGEQIIIAKSSAVTAIRKAKDANGAYLVFPGTTVEQTLGVTRVFTPSWMDNAEVDAFVLVRNAYKTGGERNITIRSDFDTSLNVDILLDETPRWGTLGEHKSAVAIKLA